MISIVKLKIKTNDNKNVQQLSFFTECRTLTEITLKAFKISHHRYGCKSWLPSPSLPHTVPIFLKKKMPAWVHIDLLQKQRFTESVVCNLHPCYVKVMLKNKGCSRRDPFPVLLKKAWSNRMFSYYARKNTEKKRGVKPRRLFTAY